MTGQDFPNYSSTEGAPSDCSVEAWPGHSEVEEDVEHEATLQVVETEGDLRYLVEDLRRAIPALLPRDKSQDRSRWTSWS